MKIKSIFLLALMLIASYSCSKKNGSTDSEGVTLIEGHWGVLDSISGYLPTRAYLIDLLPGQTYQVCLSKSLKSQYPNIEAELSASINIWAYYLGRKIPLSYSYFEVDEKIETRNQQVKLLKEKCPFQDLIVDFSSTIEETTPGLTSVNGVGSREEDGFNFTSFTRVILINSKLKSFKTISQVDKKSYNQDELLDIFIKRERYIRLTGKNEILLSRLLAHEVGHIYGLCDQYPTANPSGTNCDPNHSLKNDQGEIILHEGSVMAASTWINALFLSDDDIKGIQELSKLRPAQKSWNTNFPKLTNSQGPEHFFKINSIDSDGKKFLFDFSIHSTKDITIDFEISDLDDTEWTASRVFEAGMSSSFLNYQLEISKEISILDQEINQIDSQHYVIKLVIE